jgi:hypothetical protein
MNINKASWSTNKDNVRLSMPIGKVDIERRIVSGFATLDNLDKQDDIVSTEASVTAFSNFRGNIREMHGPSAVGKMLSFKEDRYFDPNSKKFYNGVFVSAYISKGAQDAWEKCLDGTYTGFSIGGNIKSWDDAFSEEMNKKIRIIKDYDLFELSLVDSPANQFANIVSIEKVNGESVMSGPVTEVELENVFWDAENGIVSLSEEESAVSPVDGTPMKNIGFVEKNDKDNAEMIKFLVDSAKGIKTIKMTKEDSPMTENTEAVADVLETETTTEVTKAEVAPEADAETHEVTKASTCPDCGMAMDACKCNMKSDSGAEDSTEKAAKPAVDEAESAADAASETAADEEAEVKGKAKAKVSKSDQVVVEAITEIKNSLTSAFSDLAATVKSINDQVADLTKSLAGVTEDVAKVTTEVSSVKGNFDEFGKRVDAVEQDTAFRKSGDLGEIVQYESPKTHKSLWGGRFLKNTDLFSN